MTTIGEPEVIKCFFCKQELKQEDDVIWDLVGTCGFYTWFCRDRKACEQRGLKFDD